MPSAWVHAVVDLIAYGRPYFGLHKKKDKACELLGPNHRIVDHDWYQAYGRSWNFCEPFPSGIKEFIRILGNEEGADKAEEQMAWIDHDYIDRTWDVLSDSERKYWEGFFAWALFSPDILKDWAGVDVLNGKIHRVVEDQEIWEECPYTKAEYRRLQRYVEVVKSRDKRLRDILERYR